jgi:hypothetical protein
MVVLLVHFASVDVALTSVYCAVEYAYADHISSQNTHESGLRPPYLGPSDDLVIVVPWPIKTNAITDLFTSINPLV